MLCSGLAGTVGMSSVSSHPKLYHLAAPMLIPTRPAHLHMTGSHDGRTIANQKAARNGSRHVGAALGAGENEQRDGSVHLNTPTLAVDDVSLPRQRYEPLWAMASLR